MADTIRQSAVLPISSKEFYNAWLDQKIHSDFCGNYTTIEKKIGSEISLIDGYFTGTLDLMHLNKRIVHSLRSVDFNEEDETSTLEVVIAPNKTGGIKVTLVHSNIPEGDGKKYRKVWRENYITPMKAFFKEEIE